MGGGAGRNGGIKCLGTNPPFAIVSSGIIVGLGNNGARYSMSGLGGYDIGTNGS